jgi:hypothetical protein
MVIVTRCCGVGWIFVVVDTGVASDDLNAWIALTRRVPGSSEHTPLIHVALQKMRQAAGEDAPVRLGLRLPVPKHPMYATSAAAYGALSRKPAVPTLVGCPSWRSRCSVTFTGWSKALMANPKSRYTERRSSVPLDSGISSS